VANTGLASIVFFAQQRGREERFLLVDHLQSQKVREVLQLTSDQQRRLGMAL
jgi:hypothetical protein